MMDFSTAVKLAENRFYNKTLHTSFWEDGEFNQEIRKKLLKIVDDVYSAPENTVKIDDIQLTGSLANYNYTQYSDLDVHILLDFEKINKDADLVKRALDGKRFIWNLRHDIVMHDHEVEIYYQDTNEPHVASGLYSILNNKWITEPTYTPPKIDERDVLKKAAAITDTINRLEKELTDNISEEQAKEYHEYGNKIKTKLRNMRTAGLRREGEFSVENLAFKELRNNGSIGRLIDIISKAYSLMYSEEVEVVDEINSLQDLVTGKRGPHHQNNHRGVQRKNQNWIPDTHKITRDDIVDQKVQKSKEDKFSRMLTKMEVLRACNKYGINVNKLRNGDVKELGTSKIKIWSDGKNFFIKGDK